jgi:drug/metabolite transporter (DMT)-like permease
MDIIPIYSKLLSESLLSLYPVFVKKIYLPTDLQLWVRLITYVLISLFFINYSWIALNIFTQEAIILAFINLIHIYCSYEGFANLDSGVSFSIFNIYPLLILLFSGISWRFEYFFCLVGLILFILSNFINENSSTTNSCFFYGFVMMIISAITEALIYFMIKNIKTDNNWNQLFVAYFFGAVLTSVYVSKTYWLDKSDEKVKEKEKEVSNPNDNSYKLKDFNFVLIGLALIINALIGTIGYWLRFYSINNLNISIYSVLSFFGIIMAWIYGIVFNGESLDLLKILGTIFIIISNILIL